MSKAVLPIVDSTVVYSVESVWPDESGAIAEVERLEQACRKRYLKKYGASK